VKLNLYSIYDRKMNVYLAPFPARGDVDATRNVSASMGDASMKQTPVGLHPEDFDLCKIGTFDDDSGEIERCHPLVLGNIRDIAASSTVPS
jgi:hypothetical protein